MKEVIRVLCKRDGITQEEAQELVDNTKEMILECSGMSEVEDIILGELGLELDYIYDILL